MKEKFEDLLKELEEVVKELESGELELEESIEKYQRGMDLSKKCLNKLEEAKKLVVKNMDE